MVSSFWSSQILEPSRNFRFIVRFKGMPEQGTFYAKKCSRPEIEITKTEHKFLQHTYKFPARAQWSDVNLTLVEPSTPSAIGNIHALLERSGYLIPANVNVLSSISKDKAVSQAGGRCSRRWPEEILKY